MDRMSSWWICLLLLSAQAVAQSPLDLRLRSRPDGREQLITRKVPLAETALLICDMWDDHWCKGAARRVTKMAPGMNALVEQVRSAGIPIIHAPSDVMEFYKDAPQRRIMLALENVEPPPSLGRTDPPLPIDDSDGGCDTDDPFYKAWTRQHPEIRIAPQDVISDSGPEIYSFLQSRGIKNLIIMGVHTNMCVLNRKFAIKQMTNWGVNCILVRDMTDAMYDPRDRPNISHERGTELVIEHIERYWAPTILSRDLIAALPNTQ
jgi:nicotinamidase-related amidase